MVLVMARREAGPHDGWPKALKGELEANSRKPRDQTEIRHSDSLKKGQLTLSQGKLRKGDDVADEYDYVVVRTSVLQDQETATLCTEELFLKIQHIYIALYTYQAGQNVGGIWRVNTTHLAIPAGFHTSKQ
jgi:hypothetical protein